MLLENLLVLHARLGKTANDYPFRNPGNTVFLHEPPVDGQHQIGFQIRHMALEQLVQVNTLLDMFQYHLVIPVENRQRIRVQVIFRLVRDTAQRHETPERFLPVTVHHLAASLPE